MQVYTSYFGRRTQLEKAGIVPICIALWKPKWYQGICYPRVAPKAFMLKDENQTQEQYIERYQRFVLDTLNVGRVLSDIELLSGKRDVALMCYEKPGEFCHRHLLAQWITEKSGLEVVEWEPEGGDGDAGKEKVEEKAINEPSLFDGLW